LTDEAKPDSICTPEKHTPPTQKKTEKRFKEEDE
jgi:hypothetical protein